MKKLILTGALVLSAGNLFGAAGATATFTNNSGHKIFVTTDSPLKWDPAWPPKDIVYAIPNRESIELPAEPIAPGKSRTVFFVYADDPGYQNDTPPERGPFNATPAYFILTQSINGFYQPGEVGRTYDPSQFYPIANPNFYNMQPGHQITLLPREASTLLVASPRSGNTYRFPLKRTRFENFSREDFDKAFDEHGVLINNLLETREKILAKVARNAAAAGPSSSAPATHHDVAFDIAGIREVFAHAQEILAEAASDDTAMFVSTLLTNALSDLLAPGASEAEKITQAFTAVSESAQNFRDLEVPYFGGQAPVSFIFDPIITKLQQEFEKTLEDMPAGPSQPQTVVEIEIPRDIAADTGMARATLNLDENEAVAYASFRELINDAGGEATFILAFTQNNGRWFAHFFDTSSVHEGQKNPLNRQEIVHRASITIRKVGERYEQVKKGENR